MWKQVWECRVCPGSVGGIPREAGAQYTGQGGNGRPHSLERAVRAESPGSWIQRAGWVRVPPGLSIDGLCVPSPKHQSLLSRPQIHHLGPGGVCLRGGHQAGVDRVSDDSALGVQQDGLHMR